MATGNKRRATVSLSKFPLDLPSGSLQMFAGSTAPEGWVMCDGAELDRVANAALFSVIGTTYGIGDGSTTFDLPDMRGEFARGADDMGTAQGARGVDSGRSLGSAQSQATAKNGLSANQAGHYHLEGASGVAVNNDSNYHRYGTTNTGVFKNRPGGSTGTGTWAARTNTVDPAITVSSSDAETRPRNLAINYIIKL